MRARAVIGANYGDEGKGLVTDYLCAKEGAGVVVRFNGGAQAGHTVVTPEGSRHVFHHIGSGAFLGVPTFLSRFFICNPLLFKKEFLERPEARVSKVYADPDCLVTTFADMLFNQWNEDVRGPLRHGSCGVGFHETIERSKRYPIRMRDLWDQPKRIELTLFGICKHYAPDRIGKSIDLTSEMVNDFMDHCHFLAGSANPAELDDFEDPVFEGAQGLLLDQNRYWDMPHLTPSNTGMRNVRRLCDEAGIESVLPYYVSRTYLTRHGAGPLYREAPMPFTDDTNVDHPYQGSLRYGPLDADLSFRCADDARGDYRLVLTHCDQRPPRLRGDLHSFGPTRNDITHD